jgi:hypothetical protein
LKPVNEEKKMQRNVARTHLTFAFVAAVALVAEVFLSAQGDPDRVIPGGGILVKGWTGKIDASSV